MILQSWSQEPCLNGGTLESCTRSGRLGLGRFGGGSAFETPMPRWGWFDRCIRVIRSNRPAGTVGVYPPCTLRMSRRLPLPLFPCHPLSAHNTAGSPLKASFSFDLEPGPSVPLITSRLLPFDVTTVLGPLLETKLRYGEPMRRRRKLFPRQRTRRHNSRTALLSDK